MTTKEKTMNGTNAIPRANTVHDFLSHKTMEKGGAFLKDWKEKGSLECYLHMAHVPTVVWTHKWPTIVVLEDKVTRQATKRVFGKTYVCPEPEQVLKKQYHRSRDTEAREVPPTRCGMCRLLDWVYRQIVEGKLPLEKTLFRVAGDVEKERSVIHAAGFVGMLKPEKLSDAAKERLRAAGVSFKEGFKENCMSKAGYVAVVVDAAKPSEGAQITTLSSSLGDKLKDVIRDKMIEMKKAKGTRTSATPSSTRTCSSCSTTRTRR
jgi:hypothetical protein